jgi:hypothetical protein
MLIDVQDPELNLILNGCFFGLLGVSVLSLIPWALRDGRNRWTLWLPIPALAFYFAYEWYMPTRMNIRLDLVLIWPLLAVVLIGWWRRRRRLRRQDT